MNLAARLICISLFFIPACSFLFGKSDEAINIENWAMFHWAGQASCILDLYKVSEGRTEKISDETLFALKASRKNSAFEFVPKRILLNKSDVYKVIRFVCDKNLNEKFSVQARCYDDVRWETIIEKNLDACSIKSI